MSYETLTQPVELTDDQLDAVTGGAPRNRQEGLVAVNVQDVNVFVPVVALSRGVGITAVDDA
jgi:hypothetical protein